MDTLMATKEGKAAEGAPDLGCIDLGAIFERAAVGFAILDLNGRWLRVNQSLCDLLGYQKDELMALSFEAVTHPEDRLESAQHFQQIASGEIASYQYEKRYLHKGGRTVWALLTVTRIENPDGRPTLIAGQIQDISRRREMEEALRSSEALFRSIGENAGDLILLVDFPSLTTRYASPTHESLLGYSQSELRNPLEMIHPDDREWIAQAIEANVQNRIKGSILTIRLRDKLGLWHQVEAHGCAVRSGEGELVGFLVISRLMDERLHAQQKLREREELLQLLLDSTAEAIYGIDLEGTCTFCNRACVRLLGYSSADQIMGKHVHDLIHHSYPDGSPYPEDECRIFQAFHNGSGTHVDDEVVWRADGLHFPAEYWSYPIHRDGKLAGCVVTFVDISERKAAEQALRAAHESAELFINSVPSILISIDLQGRILRWNLTAAATFRLPTEAMLGKPLADCGVRWLNQDMAAEVAGWCANKTSGRCDHLIFEKDGEKHALGLTIDWVNSPERHDGELLIIGSDVTERKSLEIQLRQAQKLEAIGQLAAGIAHEINTPTQYVGDNTNFLKESWISMAPVLSATRQVRAEAGKGLVSQETLAEFDTVWEAADILYLETEIPRAVDQSLDGIQRVAKIVRAMKEFSHPGSEEKRPLDLNKAIETTITVARNELKYVSEVVTDLQDDLPLVPCHAGEFNQVILNLLVNAAHAIRQVVGDGSQKKGVIAVNTHRDGDWVEIFVRDSGAGIPEAIRSRIFEPFFTTKPVGEGTGQGLALAHNVVARRHGGQIWFDTEVGKGTTFFIRLPLSAAGTET
jgi:PAS domain S-box-containing protein